MSKAIKENTEGSIRLREIKRFSEKIYNAVLLLLPQLNPGRSLPARENIKVIIRSKNTHLFVAELKGGKIAGLFTLVTYDIPTGKKFWIEDVVVDQSQRGKGIGEKMMLFALDYARKAGARDVDLTSRPERIAANKLYQKLGFKIRNTNAYRYNLT